MFDFPLFITITGWIFGLASLYVALHEYFEKKEVKKTIEQLRKSGFSDNLRTTADLLLPQLVDIRIEDAIKEVAEKHLLDYFKAIGTRDQTVIIGVWERVGENLGQLIEKKAKQIDSQIPAGLAECISFLFISHFSRLHGQEYLKSLQESNQLLLSVAHYYYALGKSPTTLRQVREHFESCSEEEALAIESAMKGQETTKIMELFQSEKWNRRIVSRLREYLRVRQISYVSLANKVIETNPLPNFFLVFKNEEEETTGKVVVTILSELREKGKAELITPLASIYFLKDKEAVEELQGKLPSGEAHNYVVFSVSIDPSTYKINASDRLAGNPAELYDNLLKFRDYRNLYESIVLKLGVRAAEVIETADLGFLLEPESKQILDLVRAESPNIMARLSKFSRRKLTFLTDLRNLDDDDTGFLGSLLAECCNISQSTGRELAERMVRESGELYETMYAKSEKSARPQ